MSVRSASGSYELSDVNLDGPALNAEMGLTPSGSSVFSRRRGCRVLVPWILLVVVFVAAAVAIGALVADRHFWRETNRSANNGSASANDTTTDDSKMNAWDIITKNAGDATISSFNSVNFLCRSHALIWVCSSAEDQVCIAAAHRPEVITMRKPDETLITMRVLRTTETFLELFSKLYGEYGQCQGYTWYVTMN